jgi:ABC-type lipoprotein release transport system permease subunit
MAATLTLLAAIAASVIPARRAARVDPAIALRHE